MGAASHQRWPLQALYQRDGAGSWHTGAPSRRGLRRGQSPGAPRSSARGVGPLSLLTFPPAPPGLSALIRRLLHWAQNAAQVHRRCRTASGSTGGRKRGRGDSRRAGAGTASTETLSVFEHALEFTEGLPDRTASAFSGVRSLYSPVLGMLYNAAQRLIDAKARGRPRNAADETLILLCNRLFNESFSGYVVLSHGLLGAGQHHLRAALETTNLAILFVVEPEHAERWLSGRKYTPARVRQLLDASDEFRDWYGQLSKMTHANYAATRTSAFSLGGGAEALSYGGYAAPRTMAGMALEFVWGALTFLRLFYRRYAEDLDELALLWPLELASLSDTSDLTWDRLLDVFEEMAKHIQDEIEALPDDDVPPAQLVEQILSELAPTVRPGPDSGPDPPSQPSGAASRPSPKKGP